MGTPNPANQYAVTNFESGYSDPTSRLKRPRESSQPPAPVKISGLLLLPQEIRQRTLLTLVDDEQLLSTSLSSLHALALEYAKIHPVIAQDLEYILGVWIWRKSELTNFALNSTTDTAKAVRKHRLEFHEVAIKGLEGGNGASLIGRIEDTDGRVHRSGETEGFKGYQKATNLNLVSKMSLFDYRMQGYSKKAAKWAQLQAERQR